MGGIAHAFQEGGWPMWFVLVLAMITHPGALLGVVVSLASKSRRTLFVLAAFGVAGVLATLVVGYLGYRWGMGVVEDALATVDAGVVDEIRAQGEREASQNIRFGLIASALPALAALFVGWRAMRLPR